MQGKRRSSGTEGIPEGRLLTGKSIKPELKRLRLFFAAGYSGLFRFMV